MADHPAQTSTPPQVTPPGRVSFWTGPWGYPQALTLVIGLVGTSFIVQGWHPDFSVIMPSAPWSWGVVFAPVLTLILLRRIFPSSHLLEGLGGIPLAVTAVAAWTLICLPGAIWPQGTDAAGWQHHFGLDHVISSLPFAASLGLVLMNLSLGVGKRLYPWQSGTFPFLLVHSGLLVALGSAAAGAGDVTRAQCALVHGDDFTSTAYLFNRQPVDLPFSLKLLHFRMETYPPKLVLLRTSDGKQPQFLMGHKDVLPGMEEKIGPYTFHIQEWMPMSSTTASAPVDNPSSDLIAIGVSVRDETGNKLGAGWLVANAPNPRDAGLRITTEDTLLVQNGSAKLFESRVAIRGTTGEIQEALLQVNKPVSVAGWRLYQIGYDERAGTRSEYSVIEAVRDPSVPAVYFGFFLLLAGCTIHLWNAAKRVADANLSSERAET